MVENHDNVDTNKIDDEILIDRIRTLIDKPKPESYWQRFSANPLILLIVGFILTGLVGTYLTYFYNAKQKATEFQRVVKQKEIEFQRDKNQRQIEAQRTEDQKAIELQRDKNQREIEDQRDKRQKAYAIERENQLTANRLDAEITSRLVYFNDLLMMQKIDYQEYDLSKLVIALDRPSAADYPTNVFPEYLNRNLRSLLWELMQVTSEHERESIRPAYEMTLQLQMIYVKSLYGNRLPAGQPISVAQVRAIRESFIATRKFYATFNLQRWGSPFTELMQKEHDEKVHRSEKNEGSSHNPVQKDYNHRNAPTR